MAPQVPQVITFPVPGPVVVIQQPPTIQFAPTSAPILITTAPDTITINNTRTTFNSTTSLAETNQYSLYALAGALTLGMFALLIPIGPSRGRSPTRVRIRVNPTQDVFQNRVGDWTTPQAQRKLRQKVTKERSSPNKPRLSSWYSLINRIKNKMESIRVFYASDKQERQLRKKSTKFRQTNQQLRNDRTRSKRDDSSVKHGSSLKIQDYVYPLKTVRRDLNFNIT